jgi:DNA processing protein
MEGNDLEWCERHNVKITRPGDNDYPRQFARQPYRPHFLFYWGHPVWNSSRPSISIVGSRQPSFAALEWMEQELTVFSKTEKMTIVSGGARGVDQKAHQIALRQNVPTVALIPSGLMHVYPDSFAEWIEPIVRGGGAVVSQFLPSQTMQKGFFHARNRLIAALSSTTLVIEARRQSGTMITARAAKNLDRSLGVVPTFPNEAGLGGLDLLRDDGAFMIRDALDLSVLVRAAVLIDAKAQEDEICHPGADGGG